MFLRASGKKQLGAWLISMVSDKTSSFSFHVFLENINNLLDILLENELGSFVLACFSLVALSVVVAFVLPSVFSFFSGFLDPATFSGGG
jgi:uncharacterized membrane protein YqjE